MTNDMRKLMESVKPLFDALEPATERRLAAQVEKFGARRVGKRFIDLQLERMCGLRSDDLSDTTTFAYGLDEVEAMLNDGDYGNAIMTAKDVARSMLEDEGYPFESKKKA